MPRYIFDSYTESNIVSPIHEDLDDSVEYAVPRVFFTAEVFEGIQHIVRTSPDEVAWFGLVTETERGDYLIDRLLIPEQIVTGASVDIGGEAINVLIHELLEQGEDPSRFRYHGHSHVNMSVQPSTTDQDHISEYLETSPWFIRSIHNKKGDSRVDIFDREERLAYQNVDHKVLELTQPETFYKSLDATLKARVARPKIKAKTTPKAKHANPLQRELLASKPTPTRSRDENVVYCFPDDNDDDLYYERLIDPFYAGKA